MPAKIVNNGQNTKKKMSKYLNTTLGISTLLHGLLNPACSRATRLSCGSMKK